MPLPTWPTDLLPASYELGIAANTQSGGISPFDRSEQTLEQPGARWVARLSFEGLAIAEGRRLSAFVHGLRGRAGRFLWGPPAWPGRGTALADGWLPRINGAGQTGTLLQTTGFIGGRPAIFQPGDLLSWPDPFGRPQLHQVVGDGAWPDANFGPSPSDAGGNCSIRIAPPIRRSPANGTGITLAAPVGVFRLSADRLPQSFAGGMTGALTLDIEEALF